MSEYAPRNLFLALRPTAEAAQLVAAMRAFVQPAVPVGDGRLHVTLLRIATDLPQPHSGLGELILDALGGIWLPRCRLLFDTLVVTPRRALLLPSEPLVGVRRLRDRLMLALGRAAIRTAGDRLAPHVTLGYPAFGHELAPSQRAIEPIGWQACELLLIDSEIGATRHIVRGRWALAQPTGASAGLDRAGAAREGGARLRTGSAHQ